MVAELQAPGADQRRQPQHQRRPESAMRQWFQPFAGQRPQQVRPGEQERRPANHLQQQTEDETHALLQIKAQPDNEQTTGRPHRTCGLPRQHEQNSEVDQHQAGQQHHRQTAQQPSIAAHHVIAGGQQHTGDQRQADQRRAEQTAPTRAEHRARLTARTLQSQQEQRAAQ
ncbi:hypothetical protein D3C84_601980 [compost metagenome]